jgi:hypothetical protein
VRDALWDDLWDKVTRGNQPPATSEQYRDFIDHWTAAHPGRGYEILADEHPLPIRRYEAVVVVDAFDYGNYRQAALAMHECDESESPGPRPDDAAIAAEWMRWRSYMTAQYDMATLVKPVQDRRRWVSRLRGRMLRDVVPDGDESD